jgi:nucleoside-diphosphate-sugar epimerase
MSLLSNQQGRPASVRARPPSGSPKGLSLAGQTILVTGCNSGIGQETCRVLALRGALVLGTARTKEKAAAAFATLPGKAVGYSCELSDPSSVRECRGARILSDMRPQVFQECNEIGCDTGHQHPATRGDLK